MQARDPLAPHGCPIFQAIRRQKFPGHQRQGRLNLSGRRWIGSECFFRLLLKHLGIDPQVCCSKRNSAVIRHHKPGFRARLQFGFERAARGVHGLVEVVESLIRLKFRPEHFEQAIPKDFMPGFDCQEFDQRLGLFPCPPRFVDNYVADGDTEGSEQLNSQTQLPLDSTIPQLERH